MPTEVFFYHLERNTLEDVLPALLEKCLERGWRAAVQVSDPARCAALDSQLWTYRDDSFLPHGAEGDPRAAEQPVWLTTGSDNPNGAVVRFMAEQASIEDTDSYSRVLFLFDGRDPEALSAARSRWKDLKAAGHAVSYFRQTESGAWQKAG